MYSDAVKLMDNGDDGDFVDIEAWFRDVDEFSDIGEILLFMLVDFARCTQS